MSVDDCVSTHLLAHGRRYTSQGAHAAYHWATVKDILNLRGRVALMGDQKQNFKMSLGSRDQKMVILKHTHPRSLHPEQAVPPRGAHFGGRQEHPGVAV